MKSSQEVALSIKQVASNQGVSIKDMLSECGLSKNALSSMQAGGYLPRTENICKIADYLGVSVDYLLGRDIGRDTTKQCGSITQSNVNGDNNEASIGGASLSDMDRQLLELFHRLPIVKKAEIIIQINDMLSDH